MKITDDFLLKAKDYASQGNSIIGIRGSGKSYTAMKAAEELLKEKIPILVFDPSGIWRHLRDGVNGHEGFPIVVVGGVDPDIPVTTDEDEKIDRVVEKIIIMLRAARQKGISIVVDLFAMPKNHWQKIVVACVRFLLKENYKYGMLHVFFEEAAEFIPQRPHPGNAEVYGLIEQMARVGRNFGIGYSLINQRAEEIAKAVFELCEMVFVHRQKGKNSLKSIREWLDHQDIAEAKGMVASIPKLANGECWIISEQGEKKAKILPKETFHPSPKEGKTTVPHDVKVADRSAFIKAMSEEMNKVQEKKVKSEKAKVKTQDLPADANEIAFVRAENRDLKENNSILKIANQELYSLNQESLSVIGRLQDYKDSSVKVIDDWHERLAGLITDMQNFYHDRSVKNELPENFKRVHVDANLEAVRNMPLLKEQTLSMNFYPKHSGGAIASGDGEHVKAIGQAIARSSNGELPKGERNVLIAIAQFKNGLNRKALTIITGYTLRTRNAYIFGLRNKGYADLAGDKVIATPAGKKALGSNYQPLPTGRKLQEYWLRELPAGEKAVLQVLLQAYPRSVRREVISEKTGYTLRTRNAYIYNMKAKEIVSNVGSEVKASDFLFEN